MSSPKVAVDIRRSLSLVGVQLREECSCHYKRQPMFTKRVGQGGYMALPGYETEPLHFSWGNAREISGSSSSQLDEHRAAAAPLHWYLRMMSSCWRCQPPPHLQPTFIIYLSHTHLSRLVCGGGVFSREVVFGQMVMVHGWQAERMMSTAVEARFLLSTNNAPVAPPDIVGHEIGLILLSASDVISVPVSESLLQISHLPICYRCKHSADTLVKSATSYNHNNFSSPFVSPDGAIIFVVGC